MVNDTGEFLILWFWVLWCGLLLYFGFELFMLVLSWLYWLNLRFVWVFWLPFRGLSWVACSCGFCGVGTSGILL